MTITLRLSTVPMVAMMLTMMRVTTRANGSWVDFLMTIPVAFAAPISTIVPSSSNIAAITLKMIRGRRTIAHGMDAPGLIVVLAPNTNWSITFAFTRARSPLSVHCPIVASDLHALRTCAFTSERIRGRSPLCANFQAVKGASLTRRIGRNMLTVTILARSTVRLLAVRKGGFTRF